MEPATAGPAAEILLGVAFSVLPQYNPCQAQEPFAITVHLFPQLKILEQKQVSNKKTSVRSPELTPKDLDEQKEMQEHNGMSEREQENSED
ncbi:hypothetical protein TURU_098286 [Turdus rufiventris]|nr:hypothetical protein TURU_098286 [Turdus rufiventris]